MKPFNLNLGSNEVLINDRFTLILGKFKKNIHDKPEIKNFTDLIENLNLIPLDLFLDIFKSKTNQTGKIEKSSNVLSQIAKFTKIVNSNLDLFSYFNNHLDLFYQILKLVDLKAKKESLTKELELTLIYNKSSELSAIKDLISKLKLSIEKNKQKLKYFEEDFQNIKNQMDKLTKNIENTSKEINEMTQLKKTCFNQINKITRNIEETQNGEKLEAIEKLGIDINLPNSQKIRLLQKKAQDAQFEVKQLTQALNKQKIDYESLKPEYESYMKDYNYIVHDIEKDEDKLNELSKELNEKLKNYENDSFGELSQKNFQMIRPIKIIKREYEKVSAEIKNLNMPANLNKSEDLINLDLVMEKFEEVRNKITENLSNFIINANKDVILESLDALSILDGLINEIERVYNNFLIQINLKSSISVIISDTEQKFLIKFSFYRKVNQMVIWQDLTTPEKIFSVITLFISLKISLKSNPIIFSNLLIPSKYNKRGSIFRTIRKILPLFDQDEKLKEVNLVFILSNLEIKKAIKNLKIITIEES